MSTTQPEPLNLDGAVILSRASHLFPSKLHRRLLEHPIMGHDGLCRLWIYCLLRANWKESAWLIPGTTKALAVPRGAFITGRTSLHASLYLACDRQETHAPSADTVWRWLKSLENVHNRCTIVTVCNYETYQKTDKDACTAGAQPVHN